MQKEKKRVILPGSYDPVTLGHLDVIRRAAERFSEVYAVVFVNPDKKYKYSVEDRVRMLMLATEGLDNVLVSYSLGYVVDYMREHEIDKIVKGYRNEADLEYEKIQAEYNERHGGYETEMWLCDQRYKDVSSTLARKMIEEGENLSEVLPEKVILYINNH
jgi:pantetheine-phosphate adenylyltransferase